MAKNYPTGYRVPHYNVLLISCIDLRLTDNIVQFMDHDNLTNRYDHFILAGTSIGIFVADLDEAELVLIPEYGVWLDTLKHHIDLAIQLHEVKDFYIMEHRNCGAYKSFLKDHKGDFDEMEDGFNAEYRSHLKYAVKLRDVILEYVEESGAKIAASDNRDVNKHAIKYNGKFNIHSFLMDIKGNVELLDTTKED